MATNDYTYKQLDLPTYLAMVRQRIRELETQFAQLNLRVSAPSPTDLITQQDKDNLIQVRQSLELLHGLEGDAEQQMQNPPTPTDTGSSA